MLSAIYLFAFSNVWYLIINIYFFMSTLDYDEIKPRKYILVDDVPYEILESHVARTQKRKPQT
jgi:hypothetical protein